MRVDAGLTTNLEVVSGEIARLEEMGYSGALTVQSAHTLPTPCGRGRAESEIELMTSIAGLLRSSMTLANLGHDLNAF